jgi:hypothetical protein
MVLVQGAQVVGVLSKGEGVVAARGHLVTELDPLAGHPVNVIEYLFSFFFLGGGKLKGFRTISCLRAGNICEVWHARLK